MDCSRISGFVWSFEAKSEGAIPRISFLVSFDFPLFLFTKGIGTSFIRNPFAELVSRFHLNLVCLAVQIV